MPTKPASLVNPGRSVGSVLGAAARNTALGQRVEVTLYQPDAKRRELQQDVRQGLQAVGCGDATVTISRCNNVFTFNTQGCAAGNEVQAVNWGPADEKSYH